MIPRPKILFTGFKSFAGRSVNGSETIVKILETLESPFIIQTLVMDVVWGQAEKTGLAAIESFGPDMVLTLGEGGPGIVAMETTAVNRRAGTDNSGRNADGEIEPGAPAKRLSRFGFSCKSNGSFKYPVIISGNAGAYICNNALYTFLCSPASRVVLLHIPPQGKTGSTEYTQAILPIINDLLKSNFPRIS
jgi:pyrrolidone-carboxylate peptidase